MNRASGRPLAHYLREAANLRHAIRLNEGDAAFAKNGGRILYLLDANVVGMFMSPAAHVDQLGLFTSLLDQEKLVPTATLTSEFLLSGQLPGQHGEPALISSEHFEEIIGFADKIGRAIDDLPPMDLEREQAELASKGEDLARLADSLKDPAVSTEEKLRALTTVLPESVAAVVTGPLAEALQLKRAFEKGWLERLDRRPWFHGELLRGDLAADLDWFRRIRIARQEIANSRTRSAGGRSVSAERERTINQLNDAKTVSLVVRLLNEPENEDKPPRRVLFVTGDAAISRAVETYVKEQMTGEPSDERLVFVRHPREFMPLLNLTAMSDDKEMLVIFEKLKSVVDQLLVGVDASPFGEIYDAPDSETIEKSLAVQGGESDWRRAEPLPDDQVSESLSDLEELWASALNLAFSLNIGRLERRDEETFREIADIINKGDLRSFARASIVDDLNSLFKDHAEMTVDGVFGAVRKIGLARQPASADPIGQRVPMHLAKTDIFKDIIGQRSIDVYLRAIAVGEEACDPTEELARRAGEPHVHLFLACVCLAARLWRPARDFAARALERDSCSAADEKEIYVAKYVNALALRFTLLRRSEFNEAERCLKDCIRYYHNKGQLIERLAMESELAALYLAAAVYTSAAREFPQESWTDEILDPWALEDRLTAAAKLLSSTRYHLHNDFSDESVEMTRLRLQVDTNAACFLAVINLLLPQYGLLRRDLEISDLEIEQGMDEGIRDIAAPTYVVRIYRAVLSYLLASGSVEASQREQHRCRALELVQRSRASSSALPNSDAALLNVLQKMLRR